MLYGSKPAQEHASHSNKATMQDSSQVDYDSDNDTLPEEPPPAAERSMSRNRFSAAFNNWRNSWRTSTQFSPTPEDPPPMPTSTVHQPSRNNQNDTLHSRAISRVSNHVNSVTDSDGPLYTQLRFWIMITQCLSSVLHFCIFISILHLKYHNAPIQTFISLQFASAVSGMSLMASGIYLTWYALSFNTVHGNTTFLVTTSVPAAATIDAALSLIIALFWGATAIDSGLRSNVCLGYNVNDVGQSTCQAAMSGLVFGVMAGLASWIAVTTKLVEFFQADILTELLSSVESSTVNFKGRSTKFGRRSNAVIDYNHNAYVQSSAIDMAIPDPPPKFDPTEY